jgi:hypothetical protein
MPKIRLRGGVSALLLDSWGSLCGGSKDTVQRALHLRKTARVPIAKFVGVSSKLSTNFAIVKDTSHSMSFVRLLILQFATTPVACAGELRNRHTNADALPLPPLFEFQRREAAG